MVEREKMVQKTLFEMDKPQPKRIFFPCIVAREMPIGDERCNHIKNCPECQRIKKELDKEVYGE